MAKKSKSETKVFEITFAIRVPAYVEVGYVQELAIACETQLASLVTPVSVSGPVLARKPKVRDVGSR